VIHKTAQSGSLPNLDILEESTRQKVITVSCQPPFYPDLKDLKPQSQATAQRRLGYLFSSFGGFSSDFTTSKNSAGLDDGSTGFCTFLDCLSSTNE
jgi:hypothetical protein